MIKNRTTQLIFQSIFCALAIVGCIASLGLFQADFNENFYVYYTNISNYICTGLMIVCLVKTAKANNKKEDGYVSVAPKFTFMCVIMITITCLVYNILLAKENTVVEYFTSLTNLLLHVILPVMFVLHWTLFYKHGKTKWTYPLWALMIPLVYVIYIMIRATIMKGVKGALLYPYFFLNVAELGWGGFFMWIAILLVAFTALGYAIYALDNLNKWKNTKMEEKE